jgi:hypothetical protein
MNVPILGLARRGPESWQSAQVLQLEGSYGRSTDCEADLVDPMMVRLTKLGGDRTASMIIVRPMVVCIGSEGGTNLNLELVWVTSDPTQLPRELSGP